MSRAVEGLKAIAALLETTWRRSVSTDAVVRFGNRERDPLPYQRRGGRVVADETAILEWAERN